LNVLLTGGLGYIGSHTAVLLIEAGHKVVLYDNLVNSSKDVVENIKLIADSSVEFVQVDVRGTELLLILWQVIILIRLFILQAKSQ
jgi:UDP-glucose 4-epimerase